MSKRKLTRKNGRIIEAVKDSTCGLVGSLGWRGQRAWVRVDDPAVRQEVYVDSATVRGLEEGTRVLVKIAEGGGRRGGLRGRIVEVLGDPRDPTLDFLNVVRRFDLPVEFSPEALAEAEGLSLELDRDWDRRLDLRSWRCLTIDPIEARDYDDAVSLEELPGGKYRLGVHIADVSHFVRPETALDLEARRRGASVYLLDRVVPMLPERLSADLCTLLPGQDRLTLSVLLELDDQGRVVEYAIAESIIRSAERLTYEEVQAVFDGRQEEAGRARPFADLLLRMRELSRRRRQLRLERGALDFDLPEPQVAVDAHSRPLALGRRPRLESHQLIEEFMLVANECVGRYASERRLPVLYRIHRPPDEEKLREAIDLFSRAGLKLRREEGWGTRDLQQLLAQLAGRREGPLFNRLLLQALMRAEYAARDFGHFGLACKEYLHFTSPIRRYPDLWVHRAVKQALRHLPASEKGQEERLAELGRWTSQCEQRAEEAERTYVKIKQMRFMEECVGEEFPGLISGVLRGGFFVEVGDFMVEGFCFVRNLGEYFEYDERRRQLTGRRTRRIFRIGMPVRVRVVGVNWIAQELDLELIDDFRRDSRRRRPGRKRPSRRI